MAAKKYNIDFAPNKSVGNRAGIPDCLFDPSNSSNSLKENTLPTELLVANPDNPYQVVNAGSDADKWMSELMASIRENGILSPIVVRPLNGEKFEILSGHRRHHAAKAIGLKKVPVIIRDVSDDEAAILLVDYNLNRESLLPSEKAKAYNLKKEALLRRKEKDPGSVTGNIDELIGGGEESGRNVRRYIRLLSLAQPLLSAVDNKVIPIKAGCELSYLSIDQQTLVINNLNSLNSNINEDICKRIKRYFERHPSASEEDYVKYLADLTGSHVRSVIEEDPVAKKSSIRERESKQFKLSKTEQNRYFPSTYSESDICLVIHQLLHEWAEINNPEYEKGGK